MNTLGIFFSNRKENNLQIIIKMSVLKHLTWYEHYIPKVKYKSELFIFDDFSIRKGIEQGASSFLFYSTSSENGSWEKLPKTRDTLTIRFANNEQMLEILARIPPVSSEVGVKLNWAKCFLTDIIKIKDV